MLWIYKPSSGNRGRGLRVLRGMDELKEVVMVEGTPGGPPRNRYLPPTSSHLPPLIYLLPPPSSLPPNRDGVVQLYLTNPLLVKGFKFDVRCYLLVARTSPTYIGLYHPVRRS